MAKVVHTSHPQGAREICGNTSVIRLIPLYPAVLCWWTKYFNMLALLLTCLNSIERCRETVDATGMVISYSTATSKFCKQCTWHSIALLYTIFLVVMKGWHELVCFRTPSETFLNWLSQRIKQHESHPAPISSPNLLNNQHFPNTVLVWSLNCWDCVSSLRFKFLIPKSMHIEKEVRM